MNWIERLLPGIQTKQKHDIPNDIWLKCQGCDGMLYREEYHANFAVCHLCQHHHTWPARARLKYWLGDDFQEIAGEVKAQDYLKFKDSKKYVDRITQAEKKSGETEAVVSGFGLLEGMPVVVSVFEFAYIGGSMSSGVGARILAAIDYAIMKKTPFICCSASGGARMQEGVYSLIQMARLSSALTELSDAGLPFISVLLNPTSGGVSASIAMLGDVIMAEPNALIGFAGPRVIKQTVGQDLPEGFQRSEMLLEHGSIDAIAPRGRMKQDLVQVLTTLVGRR